MSHFNFDTAPKKTGDTFVRHNPDYLKKIFRTTDVTPMWVTDIDLPIAAPIQKALRYVADRGQFAYEFNADGIFTAISAWYERCHDLTLNPKNFVSFPGVLPAISLLVRELSEGGDGVLIQLPAYHQFSKVISTTGIQRNAATQSGSWWTPVAIPTPLCYRMSRRWAGNTSI